MDKNFPGLWQCMYYGRSEGIDLSVGGTLVFVNGMVIRCGPYFIFLDI